MTPLGWVLLIGGSVLSARAGYLIFRGRQSRSWPTTRGTFSDMGTVGGGEDPVELRLQYHYSVGGRSFVGHRVSYGRPVILETYVAPGLQARGEFGDLRELTVYYDPTNPSRAVLRPGIDGVPVVELAIGLMLLWFAF